MKKLYTLLFSLLFVSAMAQVQKKSDDSNDLKLSQLPYYSYGKGLGMTSNDSIFKLNIRFRMQNRLTINSLEGKQATYDGEVRRLRLRFDGYVGNPKFLYVIQLSFAPKDMGEHRDDQEPNIIRDAAITYVPNKHWNFIFGQTKLPGNRQRTNSSGALQFTDRSINNSSFTIDRDFGIQAYYLHEQKDRFGYNIKTALSTGKGRNWSKSPIDSYALTGRVEVLPLGSFAKGGAFFEGDLAREITPKVYLGASYSYNNNGVRTYGQKGDLLYEPRSFHAVFLDAVVKYNGWAAMVAYMNRNLDDPITELFEPGSVDPVKSNYVYAGHGLDYQLSYLFPSNYEIAGRISTQNMQQDLREAFNVNNTTQYSLAATKYLWEHAFKVQAELTYDRLNYLVGPTKNNWYFRMQVEIGI